jgi:hypothetical protein
MKRNGAQWWDDIELAQWWDDTELAQWWDDIELDYSGGMIWN